MASFFSLDMINLKKFNRISIQTEHAKLLWERNREREREIEYVKYKIVDGIDKISLNMQTKRIGIKLFEIMALEIAREIDLYWWDS